MPVTLSEAWGSRPSSEGDNAQVELLTIINGTDDDLVAKTALRDGTVTVYDGLIRQSYSIKRIYDQGWLGSVIYGRRRQQPETGGSVFEFNIGTESVHITQSLETVGEYALPTETAPPQNGAIGVTDDGVQGVDVKGPIYTFSERHYLPVATVTAAYKALLFALAATTNDDAFKGFAAGEVLFLGASGSIRDSDSWEIGYSFAARPNLSGVTMGDITGIAKKGHEYLWAVYQDAVAAGGAKEFVVKKPIQVYVERVFEVGDFSGLGIGTG